MRGTGQAANGLAPCAFAAIRKTLAAAGSIAGLFIYLYVICISLICEKNRITLKYKALQRVASRISGPLTRRGKPRKVVNVVYVILLQHDFNRAILPSIAAQLAIGLKKF